METIVWFFYSIIISKGIFSWIIVKLYGERKKWFETDKHKKGQQIVTTRVLTNIYNLKI